MISRVVHPWQEPEGNGDEDQVPCVPYVPFRCPYCGRHRPYTHGSRGKIRYHKCNSCGRRYRSYELDATAVPNWNPPLP